MDEKRLWNCKHCAPTFTAALPSHFILRSSHRSQRVWELKHFVRTQLIMGGDEEKVKDLEYNDEKQGLKELIPYKTKGGLTPYARRLHGEEARIKKRR